ncbi:MAG: 5-bromo-4-chloroindolyl phosphate hydrolysis family protein [Oscillospiraceae bacterium]|jgi:hypothetical protein|nr:5-bromo-4-chloroindolyl phosphate hydrolysis family protein [Oscillospiraceae bacterium]
MNNTERRGELKKSKKASSTIAAGVILIVFGSISWVVSAIQFVVRLIQIIFFRMYAPGVLVSVLVWVIVGLAAFLMGIRLVRYSARYNKIYKEVKNSNRVSIGALQAVLKLDLETLSKDLLSLISKGFFEGAEIDLERKELVLNKDVVPSPLAEEQRATEYEIREKRSALPIYSFGLAWLLYAFVLPLYRWYDFVIALAVSALVTYGVKRVFPNTRTLSEVKRKIKKAVPVNTGNAELDELLNTAAEYMAEFMRLDLAIANDKVRTPLRELMRLSGEIFDFVRENPGKLRQLRQFMNYYLPTTLKLLENYDELSKQREKGGNILQSMTKIEGMMVPLVDAFRRELDDLFGDKAMDISADIAVMQNMIEQEGPLDSPFDL